MTVNQPEEILNISLAVSELVDGQIQQLRAIEGHLVSSGAAEKPVTPRELASKLDLSASASRDICRQLDGTRAMEQISTPSDPQDAEFICNVDACIDILESAVYATRIIKRDDERRPPTPEVEPLATLPADPDFRNVTPQEMGFEWLMPRLSSAINSTTAEIRILMPFFERGGLGKLYSDFAAALDRGVAITIITRHLEDSSSHNFAVLSEFVEQLEGEDTPMEDLRIVDYISGSTEVNDGEKTGSNPDFTLHAKVMTFDNRSVYIGSANVTDYGFDRYLELGVLLRGPPVSRFREICNFLLESEAANEVRLP